MPTRILIIDDDKGFQRILELRLKSFFQDVEFTKFSDLASARAFLSQDDLNFDLVILDEHLPDGRGMDLLSEQWFEKLAVLSVSSDTAPEIPGATLKAGATYFLNKAHASQPLFEPLVRGIIDRNRIQQQLTKVSVDAAILETVKTLVSTLRHEINNPLGAVLGAAYLLRNTPTATQEQKQAADLVDSSGKRIKHVLDQLCDAVEIESVTKARQKVFQIPGDKPWEPPEES